jgi:excisionase family DNA binding protein
VNSRKDQVKIFQGIVSVAEILHYISEDRSLPLSEAMRYLSLSERSLRKLLPEIKHYRVGSKLLFKKSDLDEWMERHVEASAEMDLSKLADEALKGLLQSS